MRILQAFAAFCQALRADECEHSALTSRRDGDVCSSYCPDCGYKVLLLWTLCRCRTCGSRRIPKRGLDGGISPQHRYCRHCGQSDYRIVKKRRLTIHEIPYAVLTPEVDYTEESFPPPECKTRRREVNNPFTAASTGPHVVEGTVLHRKEWRI